MYYPNLVESHSFIPGPVSTLLSDWIPSRTRVLVKTSYTSPNSMVMYYLLQISCSLLQTPSSNQLTDTIKYSTVFWFTIYAKFQFDWKARSGSILPCEIRYSQADNGTGEAKHNFVERIVISPSIMKELFRSFDENQSSQIEHEANSTRLLNVWIMAEARLQLINIYFAR